MAYQIKRSKQFVDTLELCDENNNVLQSLNIVIDIDTIALDYRKLQTRLITAEKSLKEMQRKGLVNEFDKAYSLYSQSLSDILALTLGNENKEIIEEFFEHKYIEIAVKIVPYIYQVIEPLIQQAIKDKQVQMKNMYKGRKR